LKDISIYFFHFFIFSVVHTHTLTHARTYTLYIIVGVTTSQCKKCSQLDARNNAQAL